MRVAEEMSRWGRGRVEGFIFNPKTGEKKNPFRIDNVITYTAADIMANMLAGNTSYRPAYMGFVYGTCAAPGLVDPDTLPSNVKRVHPWSKIASDLSSIAGGKANILISPFTTTPSVAVDGSASLYSGNSTTVAANSGSRLEYGFSTTGSVYAGPIQDDGASDYIYQALLLTRIQQANGTVTYYPFSRVSLADSGVYLVKPQSWEISLFWTISYF